MTDEELLADLMIQWEEALEQGRDVSAADLCKDCPHLVGELSRRIEALRGTSWMDKPVDGNGNDPPPTDAPDPDTPPRTLVNRYRLDQKVAEGGFAQVWKGYDLELLRTIAVKMPKPSHIGAVDSFMAEARRVARLKHPGIVPVHDVGKDGDDFFIVSEFVEDGSLGDRLKQGPIPPEQSCRWLAELADALDYAHKNGVIHRDIKPANILIDHHGRALLADFGIALSANKTGQFAPSIGTLAYMSPEQLEGKPLDPRSDVYSVGVLLCQLLTGKLPYDARDTNSLRKEIVSGAIRLSGNGGTLSPELRGICLKCLAHNPKERYATAKDLANDLRSVQPIKSHRTALVISGIAVLVTLLSVPFVWNSFFKAKEEGQQPVQVAEPSSTNKAKADEAFARGKRLFDEKKYEAALADFTEAVTADGGRAEPYHRRALCRVNLQRYEDALPDFVKAVELDPSNPEIRKHHSLALSNLGRWDEAIAALEAALKLSPADPTEYHDLAARNYSNRAKGNSEAGRWDTALPDLSAAIRHDSKPAIYHRQRGAAYFNLKQFVPAVADFTAAIEREPKEPTYYQFRGEAYKALGKQKEADADFEQARRLTNPQSKRPDPVTNSIGMVLVHIPAGEFLMGTPENDPTKAWDEIPHRVRISKSFFMGKYEVTQAQYQKVMGKNPSYCARLPNPEQHPVEQVSWDDAVAFCRAISELPDEKAAGRSYRLPTEAEWEYACRAGTTTAYHFGNDPNDLSKYALFGGHKAGVWATQKVGIKLPNAWGLHDMHGNVWEWCADEYGPYRVATEVVDPQGPDKGVGKVARGGSWDYGAVKCRSAQRFGGEVLTRSFTNFAFGFRVVMVQEARP
jgi:formylglycine-generating enzyme required for sulfatase activity/serine/threonine protein kinase